MHRTPKKRCENFGRPAPVSTKPSRQDALASKQPGGLANSPAARRATSANLPPRTPRPGRKEKEMP